MFASGVSNGLLRMSTLRAHILLLLLLMTAASVSVAQQPGSDGLGDRLYPKLGNGGYDVQHYDIDLRFTPATYRISATTTIDAIATQDLSRFNLDLHGLTVESVTVNGVEAAFERSDHELIVAPEEWLTEGEIFTVAVRYGGRPEPIKDPGVYWQLVGWQYVAGDYYITDGEPTGSMNWLPCNNHPSDKATFTIGLTVPAGHTAVSNGILTDHTQNEDATEGFVWTVERPMSVHNAFIAVGDLVIVRDDSGPVPIRNFFPRDLAEYLTDTFAETQAMMSWLVDLLGPYPFETYGVLVLQETESLTDNQTTSVISPAYATREYILHQLAHQWFGNSVTPARWEDMWLKEGFASYLEFIYPEGIWQESSRNEIASFVRGVAPPIGFDVDRLYGVSVFWRGALTLDALRREVGDEAFFDILKAYLQKFAYSNATTADFITVAETVSGSDLSALFDAWLYSEEMPVE